MTVRRPPRVVVRGSSIHGRGVFANRDLAAGERVLEYRGERIDSAEAFRRYGDNRGVGSTYLFAVNDHWLIDGCSGGGSARFVNHSCAPNCDAIVWVDLNGDERRDRVFIIPTRRIRRGEELTFDYALAVHAPLDDIDQARWQCRCGARGCRGSLIG